MARRSLSDRLLAFLDEDPRLRTLPLAARMVWLALARFALRQDGLRIPFSGTQRVSFLVSASETETETQMETLIAEGLLLRDGDGLRVPLLDAVPARSAVARANGSLGGRPRKGESPEAYALRRRQGHLALPIAGGAAAQAAETQENPAAETALTRAKKGLNNIPSSSPSSTAAPTHEAGAVAREVATMLGLRFSQPDVVQDWLDAGATAAVIRQVGKAMAQNPTRPAITSIRYLGRDVMEQVEASAPPPAENPAARAYLAAVKLWTDGGCLGPAPIPYAA